MTSEESKKTKWSKELALSHLRMWCANRERCHSEVRTKLIMHQIYGDTLEDIISILITEGFINELRFACSYASGKYRINKWGKLKIEFSLKSKGISDYCIRKAMASIDEEEYNDGLNKIVEKKIKTIKYNNSYELRKKLTAYLVQKGYPFEEIQEAVSKAINKEK